MSRIAAACVSLLVVALISVSGETLTAAPAAASTANVAVRQAAQFAAAHGVRTGVAVLDLKTGEFYGAGDYNGAFGSASVMKVLIAVKLLVTGQMTGGTAALATRMIELSDNNATNALWPRVGGPGLINWVKAYYKLPFLGSPNTRPGYWGNTHITARGMVYLYAKIKKDRRVGPWLLSAMHHYHCQADDGTNQCFGIPAAASGAAIKQGWADGSADNLKDAIINTTGYVNGDQFAVAILSEGRHNNGSTNAHGYNAAQARIVNQEARYLLPGRKVDDPHTHNPVGNVDSVRSVGSTVTVTGWMFDPDAKAGWPMLTVAEGSHRLYLGHAMAPRPDVSKKYKLIGTKHGFLASFPAANGVHTYCVTYYNVGAGNRDPKSCYEVAVNGNPRGALSSATAGPVPQTVTLAGWAHDPDSRAASSAVQIRDGDRVMGNFQANGVSVALDRALRITGQHAYTVTLTGVSAGVHRFCAYALNTGSSYGSTAVALGCRTVAVPAPVVAASVP